MAAHQFKQAGIIKIEKNKISDNDILELAINSGAEDCLSKALFHEIITAIACVRDRFKFRSQFVQKMLVACCFDISIFGCYKVEISSFEVPSGNELFLWNKSSRLVKLLFIMIWTIMITIIF